MAKVLIVDDSSTVRNEVSSFLSNQGINVDTAVDGVDGLAKIERDPDLKLVICDVNLPNMDGLTMVDKVNQSGKSIAIIMLSTESSPGMKERGKNAGVKGWIVKPFNGDAVIGAIRKLID